MAGARPIPTQNRFSAIFPHGEDSDEEWEGWEELSRSQYNEKVMEQMKKLTRGVIGLEGWRERTGGPGPRTELEGKDVSSMDRHIRALQDENKKLKEELDMSRQNTKLLEKEVDGLRNAWKKESEDSEIRFKSIMEEQKRAQESRENKEKHFAADVVSVIRRKDEVIRDVMDRTRTVIVFGMEEDEIRNQEERKGKEWDKAKKLLGRVDEVGREWGNEIEDLHRLGKFRRDRNRPRPMKIKMKRKAVAEEVLTKSWKLSKEEELKRYNIRRDLSPEEREILRAKVTEVKKRNEERTEEEKQQFFWKIVGKEIRKWRIGGTEQRVQQHGLAAGREHGTEERTAMVGVESAETR